ncbi:B-cell receptor CD22-like [Centropristis striata]|uniref:B-cell receptor CD22-like n=1 Tax=Centropristis striata TaxID=184440 RepID=UPI0027E1B3D8|nr:B-cell receptor CD22-like [Centropristis striata]
MCAAKGSTVQMHCTYTHPSDQTVRDEFWMTDGVQRPLKEQSKYTDRVEYFFVEKSCTLRISDLRVSDGDVYMFRFLTVGNAFSGAGGVTLSVTDAPKTPSVSVSPSGEIMEGSLVNLTCSRDANIVATYSWYMNPEPEPFSQDLQLVFSSIQSSDSGEYYCSAKSELGEKKSEHISLNVKYGPKRLNVSVSPSGKILEGSSVNLTCSSDANPAANITWYKENQTLFHGPEGSYLFTSISSEDRGNYHCKSENQYGKINSTSLFLDVQYAPKLPSVSVSPSAEIVEGSSVTLTCSSDANPAANYSWYKDNQTLIKGHGGRYNFNSISSEDSGNYHCISKNKYGQITSSSQSVDVQYAPKLPSVSACPSAEIVEGSSVTLICSSDANPAATITWYKENEDSAKASGQIFTITDFRAEHSGDYYCEAQNSRGSRRSTLHLTVKDGEWLFIVAGTVTAIVIVVILIPVFLWIRKKRAPKQPPEPIQSPDESAQQLPAEQKERLHYASIHFSKKQADPLNTETSSALNQRNQRKEKVESVEYATVIFNSGSTAPR